MTLLAIALPVCVCLAAIWLTGRFMRYALARRLLDVPNARSSHSVATPRGGGVAIVLTTIAALLAAAALDLVAWPAVLGMTGGGALVALIGFTDDHRNVSRRLRLLAHVAAAAWVLWWLNGLPPLRIAGVALSPGWIGSAGAVLALVWLINLTNFMDGIDGIAATEAATVCLGGALLSFAAGGSALWLPPVVLAAAALGFLRWNWPPARIFMGDAGSGFLGFMLGALALQAGWAAIALLWGWSILLGVFVVDATVTLVWRIARGERFYEAHRTHAYQHAASRRGSHQQVTLAVAAINLGWLLPIALLVTWERLGGAAGLALAYTPLLIAALLLRSGRPEQPV